MKNDVIQSRVLSGTYSVFIISSYIIVIDVRPLSSGFNLSFLAQRFVFAWCTELRWKSLHAIFWKATTVKHLHVGLPLIRMKISGGILFQFFSILLSYLSPHTNSHILTCMYIVHAHAHTHVSATHTNTPNVQTWRSVVCNKLLLASISEAVDESFSYV